MKIVYTDEALGDLDDALDFVAQNYPDVLGPFQERLRAITRRFTDWPASAREVENRRGVFMAPFVRYPYNLFYQIRGERIEILHLHHQSRDH